MMEMWKKRMEEAKGKKPGPPSASDRGGRPSGPPSNGRGGRPGDRDDDRNDRDRRDSRSRFET
ncbi:MAG: hypothetical protein NXI22_22030, partial [bacterium]|nr:hypothetical protein [bacterium]